MEIVACALWIWLSALAGLLGITGVVLQLPGRLLVWLAEVVLEQLGE